MRARWVARGGEPVLLGRTAIVDGEPEIPEAASTEEGPTYSWGPAASPWGWPSRNLDDATARARQSSRRGSTYVVTEYPPGEGPGTDIATYLNGKPSQPTEGSITMTERPASRITPDRRARRTAAQAGGSVPSEWGPVVSQAADFEPESDGHLLDWMAGQVTGMAAYAEALIEAYETGVSAVGIDPKGLAALHDVADAAAHAAETMSGARIKFADHYELPREFAANGGADDPRWALGHRRGRLNSKDPASARALGFRSRRGPCL